MKIVIAAVLLSAIMFGCSEPEHVSPTEFKKQYAAIEHLDSMKSVAYLGQKDGRAYIRISSMSLYNSKKWSDKTIYVELSELDSAFLKSLPAKEVESPARLTTHSSGAPNGPLNPNIRLPIQLEVQ